MKISKTLVAIALMLALTLALAAAAHAEPASPTPAKKGCTINLQNPDGSPGQSVVYDDGYSFSVTDKATGKTHTYKCKDGKWEETVAKTVGLSRLHRLTYVGSFRVQASGRGRFSGKKAPAGARISTAVR